MVLSFYLKKLISIFLMPLSIGLIVGVIGVIFLFKNKLQKAKLFIGLSFIIIFLIGYLPITNILLKPLESQYSQLKIIPSDVKYILLLGGDRKNRAWEALRLHHLIPDSKIITSGYQGNYKIPEAIKTANMLISIGINKNDIIINPTPKDTYQEALKIKEILKDKKFILVTSAYHMPRAMMLFQKAGLHPIPSATDFKEEPNNKIFNFTNGYNLLNTQKALHEYIGILYEMIKR
jgi:uncharacterized SAM-binding protein YcdF (DUF218 family)